MLHCVCGAVQVVQRLFVLGLDLLDEGVEDAGLEVVDLHGALDFGQGLGGGFAGDFAAFFEYFVYVGDVLGELDSALTDWP